MISSFQKIHSIELVNDDFQLDIERNEKVIISEPSSSNNFDNFIVPISCNQFINFIAAQDPLPSHNDETGFDLTQCGTKV